MGFIAITGSYYRVLLQLQTMAQEWKWKTATFFIILQHPLHFKIFALHRYTRRRPKLVNVINHRKTMFRWPETCCLMGIPISSIDNVRFYLVKNLFDSNRPCSQYCYSPKTCCHSMRQMSLSIELQINFYIFSFGVIFYFCLPNIGLQYLKVWYEIAVVVTNFFDVLYEKCKKKHFNLFILLRFENGIVISSVQFK